MSPARRFPSIFTFGCLAMALALSTACGGSDAIEPDDDTTDQGELRQRSEDLYKPKSAPVQVIPATLRNLVRWELYASERGTTVIGRSANKKAKAKMSTEVSLANKKAKARVSTRTSTRASTPANFLASSPAKRSVD